MRMLVICLAVGLACAVAGCTSTTPEGGTQSVTETVLTTDELRQLLSGRTVSIVGGDELTYFADGRFHIRDRSGAVREGTYSFRDNSVCAHTTERGERCGRYVRSGGGYVFVGVVTGDRAAIQSIR